MRLVIVESPSKTATIRGFLGPGYRVAASFGHVRDLPQAGELAVSFRDGRVEPRYQPLEKAARAIAELRRLAAEAEEVLLATDPDREGEAIAWHIAALLGRPCRRIAFQAITAAAVRAAIGAPRDLDRRLVDAQQARRVLDRVVGWLVSPTLRQVGRGATSAGRVQSVALRIVCEREREIAAFAQVDYLVLRARLERPGTRPAFAAELVEWKGEPLGQRLADATVAEKTVAWCRRQAWRVQSCERRERTANPPPPFTTATVQQAASVRLGLDPEAAMRLLQQLFEGGHITYHRTDATALAPEAVAAARAIIARDFPAAYLPPAPVAHANRAANAQEAHEAIRPTHPEDPPSLAGQAAALYALIRDRFLACQMAAGRDQLTAIRIACAPDSCRLADGGLAPMGVFQAKGVVALFDGWRRLTGGDATEEARPKRRGRPARDAEEPEETAAELPLLAPGDDLALLDLAARRKRTRPPPRYTQASLIKALERDGIGRPSTYAAIMRTILARGYVAEARRLLAATPLGLAVCAFLERRFAGNFIERAYTARMEDRLDAIARGEADWQAEVTREALAIRDLARAAGLRGDPLAG